MNEFLEKTYYHNTIENWLISIAIIILSVVIAKTAYWIFSNILKRLTVKTETVLDDLIIEKMKRPVIMLIILAGIRFALERLHFTDTLDSYVQKGFILLITINITWFVIRVIEAFIEAYLIPYSKKNESNIDDQMLLLIERIIRAVIWSIGIIAGLNNAGFDVGALIAGLGIGGLALALAAQDTVKNIFGGVMIFVDKPFRIGDRIVIDNTDGFVEYIGIRTTQIRTLPGRIVTIPNSQFADRPIENISIEPARRIQTVLGLTYDTKPEKMELAIQLLKKVAMENDDIVEGERTIVFFEKFNSFSLDICMFYFIRKESDILQTQSVLNHAILEAFNKNGLEFAFPTQTIYKKELQ